MFPVTAYIHLTRKNPYTETLLHWHTERLYACAEDKSWNIIYIHTDIDNTLPYQRRPGFCSMLKVMKENDISVILTPSINHITRSLFPLPVISSSFYFYAVKEQLLLPLYSNILS